MYWAHRPIRVAIFAIADSSAFLYDARSAVDSAIIRATCRWQTPARRPTGRLLRRLPLSWVDHRYHRQRTRIRVCRVSMRSCFGSRHRRHLCRNRPSQWRSGCSTRRHCVTSTLVPGCACRGDDLDRQCDVMHQLRCNASYAALCWLRHHGPRCEIVGHRDPAGWLNPCFSLVYCFTINLLCFVVSVGYPLIDCLISISVILWPI